MWKRIVLISLLTATISRLAWDEYERVIITRNYYAIISYERQTEKICNVVAEYQNERRATALRKMNEAANVLEEVQRRWSVCEAQLHPPSNQARRELSRGCCGRDICTKQELKYGVEN